VRAKGKAPGRWGSKKNQDGWIYISRKESLTSGNSKSSQWIRGSFYKEKFLKADRDLRGCNQEKEEERRKSAVYWRRSSSWV